MISYFIILYGIGILLNRSMFMFFNRKDAMTQSLRLIWRIIILAICHAGSVSIMLLSLVGIPPSSE